MCHIISRSNPLQHYDTKVEFFSLWETSVLMTSQTTQYYKYIQFSLFSSVYSSVYSSVIVYIVQILERKEIQDPFIAEAGRVHVEGGSTMNRGTLCNHVEVTMFIIHCDSFVLYVRATYAEVTSQVTEDLWSLDSPMIHSIILIALVGSGSSPKWRSRFQGLILSTWVSTI